MAEKHMKAAIKTINGDISNEHYKYHNEEKPVKKIKDFFVKGFQLDWVYLPHCQKMKNKFNKYKMYNDNLNLNEHGPIIIINEEKILDDVDEFIEIIKDDPYFRSLGIDRVFLKLLRIYPDFCRKKAKEEFFNWINNGNSKKYVEEIFNIQGDLEETDLRIDDVVNKIIKDSP